MDCLNLFTSKEELDGNERPVSFILLLTFIYNCRHVIVIFIVIGGSSSCGNVENEDVVGKTNLLFCAKLQCLS